MITFEHLFYVGINRSIFGMFTFAPFITESKTKIQKKEMKRRQEEKANMYK